MITGPVFARPPSRIFEFRSKTEFVEFLKQYRVQCELWGEKELSKAWKEIKEGDAVYCIDPSFTSFEMLVRCICVVSARVIINHPRHGMLVLVEFVRKDDGLYHPRRQADSSLSEKMILRHLTGMPKETSVQTIARCLKQETGLIVPHHELSAEAVTFMPRFDEPALQLPFKTESRYVEQEFSPSEKYPGLQTYRQVAHYKVELHKRHHYRRGHRDPSTKYYSFWRSVSEKGGLEPIPVDAIRNRKRASA